MENSEIQKADHPVNNDETIFTDSEFSLESYNKQIRQARNAIFAAAIVLALNLVFLAATNREYYEYLWLDFSIWGAFIAAFVALGFYTKKKPYTAIVCALILYGLFIVLNAMIDITTIYKGIIIKIIIVVTLVRGINDAKEAQRLKEQMGQ